MGDVSSLLSLSLEEMVDAPGLLIKANDGVSGVGHYYTTLESFLRLLHVYIIILFGLLSVIFLLKPFGLYLIICSTSHD